MLPYHTSRAPRTIKQATLFDVAATFTFIPYILPIPIHVPPYQPGMQVAGTHQEKTATTLYQSINLA